MPVEKMDFLDMMVGQEHVVLMVIQDLVDHESKTTDIMEEMVIKEMMVHQA